MNGKLFFSILLVMVVLLTGCNIVVAPTGNITPTPFGNGTQFVFPTETRENVTPMPLNNNQLVSPASTELAHSEVTETVVTETCPNIEPSLRSHSTDLGKILFIEYDQYKIMSLDLDTWVARPFIPDNEIVYSFALSYNGKWLAYQSEDVSTHEKRLAVVTGTGNKVFNIPWEDEWEKVSYWLDNDHIVIKKTGDETPALLILDPFSNDRKELISKFPNIYFLEYPPDWNGSGRVVYDSTLTRAVYAGTNQRYVLWNVETNSHILYLQTTSFLQFPVKAPQWSLDGNQVIMAAPGKSLEYMNDELFLINRNAGITKLTNLSDNYDRVSIDRYSWSPDGSYIALLFSADPSNYNLDRLAILNYFSSNIDLYCIQGNLMSDYRRNPQGDYDLITYTGVAWSPDSHKVLLENRTAENSSRIIMIDVVENTAYQILEGDMSPIGWILNNP